MTLPDWFYKIKEIQDEIDRDRDRLDKEETDPHPTRIDIHIIPQGHQSSDHIF